MLKDTKREKEMKYYNKNFLLSELTTFKLLEKQRITADINFFNKYKIKIFILHTNLQSLKEQRNFHLFSSMINLL